MPKGKTQNLPSAAIGVRAHSGWAAVVVIGGSITSPEIIDRRKIELIDGTIRGAKQPYHEAEEMPLNVAEEFLKRCTDCTNGLATQAIRNLIDIAESAGYEIVGCGLTTSSAKPLPELVAILASHPMIHTAEGVFYREAIAQACQNLGLPVTKIKEKDIYNTCSTKLRFAAEEFQARINGIGRTIGPPWSQDQKFAAVSGLLALRAAS